jgi:hypothetical protein
VTLVSPELLRQPDKYMKYGFLHQPWDLLWEPFTALLPCVDAGLQRLGYIATHVLLSQLGKVALAVGE